MTTGRRWLGVRREPGGVPSAAAVLSLLHLTHCLLLHHVLFFVSCSSCRCSCLPGLSQATDVVFPACLRRWQRRDAEELLGVILQLCGAGSTLCLGRGTSWSRRTRGSSEVRVAFLCTLRSRSRRSPGPWLASLKGNLRRVRRKVGQDPPDTASGKKVGVVLNSGGTDSLCEFCLWEKLILWHHVMVWGDMG